MFTDLNPGDVSLERTGSDLTVRIAESAPGAGDAGSGAHHRHAPRPTTARASTASSSPTARPGHVAGAPDAARSGRHAGQRHDQRLQHQRHARRRRRRRHAYGGDGNDTYVYARGDGNDTIVDPSYWRTSSADRLVFTDIDPGDVSLVRSGNDVTLVIAESEAGAGDGGSVLLSNDLSGHYDEGVETIAFADGTSWTRSDIRPMLIAQAETSGDDTISGFNVADVIDAGAGNDTVNAGDGNDVITGGRGDDTLSGGNGNDTYVYARGDGNDTISRARFLLAHQFGRQAGVHRHQPRRGQPGAHRQRPDAADRRERSRRRRRRLGAAHQRPQRPLQTRASTRSPSPTGRRGTGRQCVPSPMRRPTAQP